MPKIKKEKIYITYCCDDNYYSKLKISILSLVTNSNHSIAIKLISDNISSAHLSELKKIINIFKKGKTKHTLTIYKASLFLKKIPKNLIDNDFFVIKDRPDHKISSSALIRLILPYIFNKKFIYLDADTIVNNDLQSLYNTDLSNFSIGAVISIGPLIATHDKKHKVFFEYLKNDCFKNSYYFNSGVLLINPIKWRKQFSFKKMINIFQKNKDCIKLIDQDLLNIMFANNFKVLNPCFNFYPIMTTNQYFDFYSKLIPFSKKDMCAPVIFHYQDAIDILSNKKINKIYPEIDPSLFDLSIINIYKKFNEKRV